MMRGIAPEFLDAYQSLSQSAGSNVTIDVGGHRFQASPEIIQGLTQGVSIAALNSMTDNQPVSGRISEDRLTDLGLTPDDVGALHADQDGGQRWYQAHELMGVLAQRQETRASS